MKKKKPLIKIGTSGWMYNHWKGIFYPSEIASRKMLSYFSQHFKSVEINNTFYQKPDKEKIKNWRKEVPPDFLFAVKANRYITHMKNLKGVKKPVENLLSVVKKLDQKLGPILFQLPPRWHINEVRFKKFLKVLPSKFRYVIEFRHPSWYKKEILQSLEKKRIAFCIHDHKDAPSPIKITADFTYIRFHGPDGYYQKKYSDEQISDWAKKIRAWRKKGVDVYAYFNNDSQGFALQNSKQLIKSLS